MYIYIERERRGKGNKSEEFAGITTCTPTSTRLSAVKEKRCGRSGKRETKLGRGKGRRKRESERERALYPLDIGDCVFCQGSKVPRLPTPVRFDV
jgi:hypothetical protein